MRFVILAAAILALVGAEKAAYNNYRVYRVQPVTRQQVDALKMLEETNQYSFWTDLNKVNLPVDIMVAPHLRAQFHEFVNEHRIPYHVSIDDVQSLIGAEETSLARSPKAMEWTNYHSLDEIYAWLDALAQQYTNVKTVIGGTTYENRQIKGIEITNGANLPGLVIESGIHAREWIGPAATSWIVDKILNSATGSVWRKFNYIYFPSVNPDGYVYTWTDDRLWRKTRQPYKVITGTCYGADPNRNFDNHWMQGGSSNNACSETFAGSAPFSEVETKSLSTYLRSVSSKYDLYISYHSYSQLLMFPWGYTSSHAPLHDLWQRIGNLAAASLQAVHGTHFDVGNIYDTIYQVSGSSLEWYYGEFNSTITYTYETRDTGRYGFVLPPEQIIPCAEEHLASLQTILDEYLKL